MVSIYTTDVFMVRLVKKQEPHVFFLCCSECKIPSCVFISCDSPEPSGPDNCIKDDCMFFAAQKNFLSGD